VNLTTLCAAKTYLQIPDADTGRDAVIRQLIPQVSAAIEKYCGRSFGVFEYTDYYYGDGTPTLVLNNRPVVPGSLTVWQDDTGFWGQGEDAFGDVDLLVEGEDYALEIDDNGLGGSGVLRRIGAVWPEDKWRMWLNQSPELSYNRRVRQGNLKVRYTAGVVPAEVQLAANMTLSSVLQMNQTGGPLASESYEDYARSFADVVANDGYVGVIPPQARSLLAGHRELWFA